MFVYVHLNYYRLKPLFIHVCVCAFKLLPAHL